jgi:LPXTG-motif cell wall-anchored protein
MKKFALGLMAMATAVFGFGLAANAYPPGAGSVTATPPSGAAGYSVSVKATCLPGEAVTVVLVSSTATGNCGAAGTAASLLGITKAGSVTLVVKAPATAGTYTGSATGATTGALGTFRITVTAPPAGLPATGSNGVSTMTIIAIGLFAVGAGLFGVSQVRRRQNLSV